MAKKVNENPNEESSRSQCAMILDWLERGFSINWMQARINDLRNNGHNIKTNMVRNEFTGKKYADYTLVK